MVELFVPDFLQLLSCLVMTRIVMTIARFLLGIELVGGNKEMNR